MLNLKEKLSVAFNLEKVRGKNTAQSTLELLIALSLIVIAISGVVVVSLSGQSISVDTQLSDSAALKAREDLENARANARENWAGVVSNSVVDGQFTRDLIVEDIDNYEKKVTAKVSWITDPLRPQKVELITILTDWTTLSDEGGGSDPVGEWNNPRTAGTIDLGPGNEGTDLAVVPNTVFIVAEASDPKKPDFYSINVTNIDAPTQRASIDTGKGLNSISVLDNYAYVAHKSNTTQLQVIDVTNPDSPVKVGQASLQSNGQEGKTIFALNGYAYVGSKISSGSEFQVFDISTPSNPTFVGSAEIGADVNDIYVYRNRAYLATSKTTGEILIFDIVVPSSPQQIASFDYSDTPGLSVFANSFNDFYAGIGNTFVIVNSTNLSSLSLISAYGASGLVNDLYIREYLSFLSTTNSTAEFQAVNITNKASLILQLPPAWHWYNLSQQCCLYVREK
jgi:type II secretory pathway pseudopilin PulG